MLQNGLFSAHVWQRHKEEKERKKERNDPFGKCLFVEHSLYPLLPLTYYTVKMNKQPVKLILFSLALCTLRFRIKKKSLLKLDILSWMVGCVLIFMTGITQALNKFCSGLEHCPPKKIWWMCISMKKYLWNHSENKQNAFPQNKRFWLEQKSRGCFSSISNEILWLPWLIKIVGAMNR